MTDLETLVAKLNAQGYKHVLKLPGGMLAAVHDQLFTTGLVVGLDSFGYQRRYCYEKRQDAVDALMAWDGQGDPPGPWIKEKPSDRLGPGATGTDDIDSHG